MPKRKQKAVKEKPKDTTKYVTGIVIAIIVIVVLILLIRSLTTGPAQAPTAPTTPPVTTPVTQGPAPSGAPALVRNCSTSFAIGWPKSTVITPCKVTGNTAQITLLFSGRGTSLPGMWFQLSNVDGSKVSYLEDKGDIAQGAMQNYTIDITGASSVLALPMIVDNGQEKACLNQRLIIIKDNSCAVQ